MEYVSSRSERGPGADSRKTPNRESNSMEPTTSRSRLPRAARRFGAISTPPVERDRLSDRDLVGRPGHGACRHAKPTGEICRRECGGCIPGRRVQDFAGKTLAEGDASGSTQSDTGRIEHRELQTEP